MMKKTNALLLSASCLLVGCASTTVYPEGDNTYSLVTTSGSEGAARKNAMAKAKKHCELSNQKLVIISHDSKYQGSNKDQKAMIGLAAAVLGGTSNPANTNSDYQVAMKFKCV